MSILESTGIEILDVEALDICAKTGVKVDVGARRIWPDRSLLLEAVSTAPASFTLHARNEAKSLVLGGNHIASSPVVGQAYSTKYERRLRPGTLADFEELIKHPLFQYFVSWLGYVGRANRHSRKHSPSRFNLCVISLHR